MSNTKLNTIANRQRKARLFDVLVTTATVLGLFVGATALLGG